MNGRAKGKNIIGCHSVEELVANSGTPRKVMLMVKAGQAGGRLHRTDAAAPGRRRHHHRRRQLHFPDTIRRTEYVESKGLLYIGTGVSGGEEGACRPVIMPGGSPKAWPHVKPIFQAIAAKVEDGSPCCDWVGENGAGHFVKMVHNGIEYGDMQMICEAYQMMKTCWGMSAGEMHEVFKDVERGRAGQLPDRDHPRHPGYKDETASRRR
jgi:6-phosphogluconate dehydrogenase